jgi:hypothetical protein
MKGHTKLTIDKALNAYEYCAWLGMQNADHISPDTVLITLNCDQTSSSSTTPEIACRRMPS